MTIGRLRIIDPPNTVVFSDRPLDGTKSVSVGYYGSGGDAADIARKEREYWRQRSDAFAERQLARDRDLEATRRASIVADKRANEAAQIIVIPGGVSVIQNQRNSRHAEASSSRTVYETSPGAVNGRFSTVLPTQVQPIRVR